MTTSAPRSRTDHEIKEAISEEIDWTPSVTADRIVVAVTDGAVTLSGRVQTYPEKEATSRAATRVRGVTSVIDDIVVEHFWGLQSDADVAREARVAFEHTVVVPPGSVRATVHDHVITLAGTVDWQFQREAAVSAVTALPGVSGVRNTITLRPSTVVYPEVTKAKIAAAFVRDAQLDAEHILVKVAGSEVTLAGRVPSWSERCQAENAAWCAPGVTDVHNQLIVSSGAST